MAPHLARVPAAVGTPTAPDELTAPKGPNPGQISIGNQYTVEQKLRQMLRDNGCDPAREDNYRLQGIQLIDNVRESLQLPVRTFDTAANYYHKFRLSFRDAEYNYQDAALASLFVACKVEDTIKKSKEILCASYNLRHPDHPLAQDDKTFEQASRVMIGLERLILETIGFDFRGRFPQKLLVKIVRKLVAPDEAKKFLAVAYDMCIDIYKTFAPVKQTTFTMVMAVVELTALVTERNVDEIRTLDPHRWHTTRDCTIETMLDLLDLYTQFTKSTKVGGRFALDRFIDVKIKINKEVEGDAGLARFQTWCRGCQATGRKTQAGGHDPAPSPAGVATNQHPGAGGQVKRVGKGNDYAMRFVFDQEQAQKEMDIVQEFFKEEFEEYEIEVEEPIPESEQHHRGGRGNPRRVNHGHNYHDHGWTPYHRNRHGYNDRHVHGDRHGHSDRHKGRKGGHGGYR